jgi:hypothetical protein
MKMPLTTKSADRQHNLASQLSTFRFPSILRIKLAILAL